MAEWLPVIGTLLGAIVAGAISIIVHRSAHKHALASLKIQLSEERARWATEHELNRIQNFYGTVEKLMDATGKFRVRKAFESRKPNGPYPEWVLSENDARGNFEHAIEDAYSEVMLLDKSIHSQLEEAMSPYMKWMLSETHDEGIKHLQQIEINITHLRETLGSRYRDIFEHRRTGKDF